MAIEVQVAPEFVETHVKFPPATNTRPSAEAAAVCPANVVLVSFVQVAPKSIELLTGPILLAATSLFPPAEQATPNQNFSGAMVFVQLWADAKLN